MGPPQNKLANSNTNDSNDKNNSDASEKYTSGSSGKSTDPSPDTCTPSSSDTVPVLEDTQEVTGSEESTNSQSKIWGIVRAVQPDFIHLELTKDRYTFGRAKHCDYSFDIPSIKSNEHYKSYSKMQFALKRTLNEDGTTNKIFLEDLGGTNGTFVNGEKVPTYKQRCIKNHDEIALAYSWNTIFSFKDDSSVQLDTPKNFSSKYILHKLIGKGACGEVFEVCMKEGISQFACKIVNKSCLSMRDTSHNHDIMKEAKLLQDLSHPCIISVVDVIDSPNSLYIVLEYAVGGDLFYRLNDKGPLPESVAKLYFFQMLSAVAYLHENGITHRDLKPENILLMTKEEPSLLKITDFGMSRLVKEESLMMTLAGTPSYLAPEIINRMKSQISPGYTKLVDMWSLGVLLYVCLVAYPPFSNERNDTSLDIYHQITTANFNFNHSLWKNISQLAKQLVTYLLKINASERLNTSEALDHLWLDDSKMREQANQLMYPNFQMNFNLMGEKSLSIDSYGSNDTSRISTDNDCDSKNGDNLYRFDLGGPKRQIKEFEKPNAKQVKLS